jgi:hypothetical protein
MIDLETTAQDTASIIEICINNIGGGGMPFSLGRSGNTPVQQGGLPLAAEDSSTGLSYSTLGTLWTVAPIVPVQMLRRCAINNGRIVIYTFPRGLLVAAGSSMVLWQPTNSPFNANSSWEISE